MLRKRRGGLPGLQRAKLSHVISRVGIASLSFAKMSPLLELRMLNSVTRRLTSSPSKQSNLLASLDALDINEGEIKPASRRTARKLKLDDNDTQSQSQYPRSILGNNTQNNALDKTRRAATISTQQQASPVKQNLRLYSYKDYPKTCIVYTTHEEEANELIEGLCPGYVPPPLLANLLYTD